MQILKTNKSFKKEFRHQIRLAIVAAIGFSVAFAWREAIFSFFQSFVSRFLDLEPGHYMTEIWTSIAITVAGVLLIMLTSKLLKEN
jgi:putative Mn2+ efflux pump MntP